VIDTPKSTTFKFTKDLSRGMTNSDVMELQKRLIEEGFLKVAQPGSYFGNMTFAAVQAYQKKHGLPQVGRVGPKTRDVLNGGSVSSMTQEQRQALIALLQSQLKVLLAKIAEMTAAQAATTTPPVASSTTPVVSTSTATSTPTN
jgi:peptidoglycan hydrolase-like protein with peptidoglycan-binding domain